MISRFTVESIEEKSRKNRASKAAVFGKLPAAIELPLIKVKPKKPANCKGGCPPMQTCDYCAGPSGLDKVKRPNKYGAVKSAEGDSRKEVRRLQELRWLQREGKIVHLASQVRYTLIPKQLKADGTHERAMTYTCDAQYLQEGALVVEDTKSEATRKLPRYVAARKLMLQLFNIEIQEM